MQPPTHRTETPFNSELRPLRMLNLTQKLAKVWRLFGTIIVLSFYFFIAGPTGYTAFAILQLIPVRNRDRRARKLQNTMKLWIAFMHAFARRLRVLDFHPRYLEGVIPARPCVIVANHPTFVDVTALIASIPQTCSVVKPVLFRRFWTRPLLEQAGYFAGVDNDPKSLERMIADAVERIKRGYHVIVFPEGTRSPSDGLHPFGRAAFEVAARAKAPVLPVVIECQPRWLTKDQGFLRPPVSTPRLRLRALPAIDPVIEGLSSRALRQAVRTVIGEQLGRWNVDVLR